MKLPWLYLVLAAVWTAAALTLWFGWIPRPGGGAYQSELAAGLALLMAAWNVVRARMVAQRKAN